MVKDREYKKLRRQRKTNNIDNPYGYWEEQTIEGSTQNFQMKPITLGNLRVYWYQNQPNQTENNINSISADDIRRSQPFSTYAKSYSFYHSLGPVAKILVCYHGIIKKEGLNYYVNKCRSLALKDGILCSNQIGQIVINNTEEEADSNQYGLFDTPQQKMTIESNSGWESNDNSLVEPIVILNHNDTKKVANPIYSIPEK